MWFIVFILSLVVWWFVIWLFNGLVFGGRVGVRFKEDISFFKIGRNLYEMCYYNNKYEFCILYFV